MILFSCQNAWMASGHLTPGHSRKQFLVSIAFLGLSSFGTELQAFQVWYFEFWIIIPQLIAKHEKVYNNLALNFHFRHNTRGRIELLSQPSRRPRQNVVLRRISGQTVGRLQHRAMSSSRLQGRCWHQLPGEGLQDLFWDRVSGVGLVWTARPFAARSEFSRSASTP